MEILAAIAILLALLASGWALKGEERFKALKAETAPDADETAPELDAGADGLTLRPRGDLDVETLRGLFPDIDDVSAALRSDIAFMLVNPTEGERRRFPDDCTLALADEFDDYRVVRKHRNPETKIIEFEIELRSPSRVLELRGEIVPLRAGTALLDLLGVKVGDRAPDPLRVKVSGENADQAAALIDETLRDNGLDATVEVTNE